MRSLALTALVLAASAGCGLINGGSEGEFRSPFAGLLGGCDSARDCVEDGRICDWNTGTCGDPDVAQRGCPAADAFDNWEGDGPLLFDASLDAESAQDDEWGTECTNFDIGYSDPDGDWPELTDAQAIDGLSAHSDDGDVTIYDLTFDSEGDERFLNGTVCSDSSDAAPTEVAFYFVDPNAAGSNAVCAYE